MAAGRTTRMVIERAHSSSGNRWKKLRDGDSHFWLPSVVFAIVHFFSSAAILSYAGSQGYIWNNLAWLAATRYWLRNQEVLPGLVLLGLGSFSAGVALSLGFAV